MSNELDSVSHLKHAQRNPADESRRARRSRSFRFLFCVPTTQLSGGVKVIFAIADRMVAAGHRADVFSWANAPEWCTPRAALLPVKDLNAVDMEQYDFVVVSNAMLIPMVLPLLKSARCVFLALDYEAFHHAGEVAYESFLSESPIFKKLYALPVPIIATSRPIKRLVEQRIGKPAFLMPVGIDKTVFKPMPRKGRSERKRILLVGNYLMPYKGMRDAFEAIDLLSGDLSVELVLITQEERGRHVIDAYEWPKEIHFCPVERDVPAIIASCDVYCCSSWYEGLGLPALESFCCGTPVVSTRTVGVDDYAEDGINLLLANPNDPPDLAEKLRRVLVEDDLRERLIAGGFGTMSSRYDWLTSERTFLGAIEDIDADYAGAGTVDAAEMQSYLDALEQTGSFTPIEVFREFHSLADRLHAVSKRISDGRPDRAQLAEIASLRDSLERFLINERAQYYEAFKAKFDFCQLLLDLSRTGDSRLVQLLISPNRPTTNGSHAVSLTETRYP